MKNENTKGKQRARTSSAGTLLRLRCPSAAVIGANCGFGVSHTGIFHPVAISTFVVDDRFSLLG